MSPCRLRAVLAPFLGGWGRRGWGGGASSLSVLWRKHVASTAQARGAALVPLQGGGGLAVWLPSSPFLPCVRSPGAPPAGACTARASYGHGRVVRPAPSLRRLPTLPLCPRGGGGGGAVRPSLPSPPTLGGAEVCVGGGGGLSSSLRCTHVAGTTLARRRHEVRHLSLCKGGGGMPCGFRRRPSYPAFAPPMVPPLGLARRVPSSGTVVWSVPHPLAAASPPCRFVLGGGGRFSPPPPASPTLGGAEVCGGGGRPCRLPFVARTSQAWRRHEARHLSLCRGGGLPCVTRRRPSYLACAPPGGRRCVWGGGGRPCRRPFIARMSQARRKHDASTGCGTWLQRGGGVSPLGLPALLHGIGSAPQDLQPPLPLGGSRQDAHGARHDAWQLSPTLPPLLPPSPSVLAWC